MYKKTLESTDSITNVNDNVSKLSVNKNDENSPQVTVLDVERIGHLKTAINEGNFTINTLRVAEKFIQFENQLGP